MCGRIDAAVPMYLSVTGGPRHDRSQARALEEAGTDAPATLPDHRPGLCMATPSVRGGRNRALRPSYRPGRMHEPPLTPRLTIRSI